MSEGNDEPPVVVNPELPAAPEVPEPAEPQEETEDLSMGLRLAVILFFVVGLATTGLILYRIYPAHHPHKENPGFVDAIFDNNLVLFASRLVLFCVAIVLAMTSAFVIASISAHWFKHKQWITSFGPFKVAEKAVEELTEQIDFLQTLRRSSDEEITRLTRVIEETNTAYDGLLDAYGEAQSELEELRGKQGD
jgi:hypothetical protein